MIRVIIARATRQELEEMLVALGTYVKIAVDVRRGVLAGGGVLHADCESALLDNGSVQDDVWGADWSPAAQQVTFESLINIRPALNNPSIEILDPATRRSVADIVHRLLGGV